MLVTQVLADLGVTPAERLEIVDAIVSLACLALLGLPEHVKLGDGNKNEGRAVEAEVGKEATLVTRSLVVVE